MQKNPQTYLQCSINKKMINEHRFHKQPICLLSGGNIRNKSDYSGFNAKELVHSVGSTVTHIPELS